MTMLLITILFLAMMFIFLNHPLSFGLILLIQTVLISIMTGMMNYTFWFSYILFLIMVGGMLILFIYMTSVASNEKFKLSYSFLLLSMFFLFIEMIALFADKFFYNMNLINKELIKEQMENSLSMSKFLNFPMNLIMFLVIVYLLIVLIMVVKITNIKYGPLRQKF
nr:NADH dehydrogenase subunit 6 [Stenodryas sp. N127]